MYTCFVLGKGQFHQGLSNAREADVICWCHICKINEVRSGKGGKRCALHHRNRRRFDLRRKRGNLLRCIVFPSNINKFQACIRIPIVGNHEIVCCCPKSKVVSNLQDIKIGCSTDSQNISARISSAFNDIRHTCPGIPDIDIAICAANQRIVTSTAAHNVHTSVSHDIVITSAPKKGVVPRSAGERIVTTSSIQTIITVSTREEIVTIIALHFVIATATKQIIAAITTDQGIITGVTDKIVIPSAAIKGIVPDAAIKIIGSFSAKKGVVSGFSFKPVIAASARDLIICGRGQPVIGMGNPGKVSCIGWGVMVAVAAGRRHAVVRKGISLKIPGKVEPPSPPKNST